MPIRFPCPHCARTLRVKDELAGKRIRCPNCSSATTVHSKNQSRRTHHHWRRRRRPLLPLRTTSFPISPSSCPRVEPSLNTRTMTMDWKHCDQSSDERSRPFRGKGIRAISSGRSTAMMTSHALREKVGTATVAAGLIEPGESRLVFRTALDRVAPLYPAGTDGCSGRSPSCRNGYSNIRKSWINSETVTKRGELCALFPNDRLPGAHLARHTGMHWVYAAISLFGYWALLSFSGASRPRVRDAYW